MPQNVRLIQIVSTLFQLGANFASTLKQLRIEVYTKLILIVSTLCRHCLNLYTKVIEI